MAKKAELNQEIEENEIDEAVEEIVEIVKPTINNPKPQKQAAFNNKIDFSPVLNKLDQLNSNLEKFFKSKEGNEEKSMTKVGEAIVSAPIEAEKKKQYKLFDEFEF